MPEGQWRTTRIYEDVAVAADMHWEVSKLWGLSDHDQAFLIAHHRASGTIKAYQDHLHEKAMTAAARKKK